MHLLCLSLQHHESETQDKSSMDVRTIAMSSLTTSSYGKYNNQLCQAHHDNDIDSDVTCI